MKTKKIISILCAASIFLMSSVQPVCAADLTDEIEVLTEVEESSEAEESSEVDATVGEDVVLGDIISLEDLAAAQNDAAESLMLDDMPDIASLDVEVSDVELQSTNVGSYDLDSATSMGTLSRGKTRSADSITQSFTGFIMEEGDASFVQFSLEEGEIFNASLVCPNNANLNYDLVLASVANDGSLSVVSSSTLGTYIDPETGKTVDEGISYVHNQATTGNFAILVIATTGSSSVNSFTLTVSLDAAGSYDRNEPNDSPYTATRLSSLSTTGSLHVVNDQDWYVVNMNSGVYKLTAGNYQAEVYFVEDGNLMVREQKAGSNYVLDSRTYYIKVFSNASQDNFEFGDYTLEMVDQSKYATIQTAFDYGDWEHAYTRLPAVIPTGQRTAYYKFTIDEEDKAYASFIIDQGESGTLIEFLDNTGETQAFGFTGNPTVNIPVTGVIQKSNSSLKYLVVNIDGNRTNSIGYIRITKVDKMDIAAGGIPSIFTRIYSGYDTFRFSGTAKNSGGSISTVLTLDLTNSSKIPPHAIVDRITTSSSINHSVGGVYHQLNPSNLGWIQARNSGATSGDFNLSGYGVEARTLWQFRYSQTALKSTEMSRVDMKIYWDYDIQYTNYELFK